jgi:hypothetical protein
MKRKQKLWFQSHYRHGAKKEKENKKNEVRIEHGLSAP